jgi:SAM-dependent methyltransferase
VDRNLGKLEQHGEGLMDRSARTAYDGMASFYDAFTAHHDYELWLGNLLPAIDAHRPTPGKRLLDVGCGTGKSFLPMVDRGWSVTGVDVSPRMVEQAQEKIGAGDRVEVLVGDARELPILGSFDLVWCLDDGLNYMLTEGELQAALTRMGRNLDTAGVVAFDLNTLLSFRTFFAEEAVVEREGHRMVWQGHADPSGPAGMLAEATLSLEGAKSVAARVIHRERHFAEPEVLEAIQRAGLRCVDVFGIYYDAVLKQPLDEEIHTKAIYLAKQGN